MPKNTILTPETASVIGDRMERVLRDLGDPEPPLCLRDVRALLDLDLKHYSSTDVTWLQEKLHKLKIAGKQVIARPQLMLDVVKKLDLKALVLLDQKRILVDRELPVPKQRWNEAHEIVHSILPWHEGVAMGDEKQTLSPSCHNQIESEANYGAGRLLFLGDRFANELASHTRIDFDVIKALKKLFGNSLTTTFWRVVENLNIPAFGLVSSHPRTPSTPGGNPVRYFIRSCEFAQCFSAITEFKLFSKVQEYCRRGFGPIGSNDVVLQDISGQNHIFFLETFCHKWDALTLGTCRKPQATSIAVS